MDQKKTDSPEEILSRRSLLIHSAKLTAGAAFFGIGIGTAATPAVVAEIPGMTEEIAASWTTF